MACYIKQAADGSNVFICGDLGPHCYADMCVAEFLCDYPVGEGKTCDRPMCADHAHEAAPDIHYCQDHETLWREFRKSGGVERELTNVVPYKREGE